MTRFRLQASGFGWPLAGAFALALAFVLAAALPAVAGGSALERARERYGFAGWPGREGPSRDGIDLASLEGAHLRALPDGPVATFVHAESRVVARVWVEEAPAAAHERLIEFLAGSSGPLGRIDRGDIGFGADGLVAFARANVCAVVRGSSAAAGAVARIARMIDGLVERSPVLDGSRPRTSPEIVSIRAGDREGGRRVRLLLDLRGEVVRREVRAEGGAFVDDDGPAGAGGGGLVLRAPRPGAYRVTVHLPGPRGWRASRTVEIAVE